MAESFQFVDIILPVEILSPWIAVVPLVPNDNEFPPPFETESSAVNVTKPVNPIACLESPNVGVPVPPPAVVSTTE